MPSWSAVGAVRYLQWNAEDASQGNCARHVREAVERGGIRLSRTADAKDYGYSSRAAGFHEVSASNLRPGDVIVIQAIAGHPHGHMAMFDGQIWMSDFRQYRGFYPGESHRRPHPPYKIYRHD